MTHLTDEQFAMVCFLVLMENGKGIMDKAPAYIDEKMIMMEDGQDAFGRLDIFNMRKVKEWCDIWNVKMPDECMDYLIKSEQAYEELQGRGFEL